MRDAITAHLEELREDGLPAPKPNAFVTYIKVAARGDESRNAVRIATTVLPWYYSGMKTAISLPDDLFASADALAARLGMTRSGLIAAALSEYIAKHRSARISERLNAVYSAEESRLDEPVRRAQGRAVRGPEEW